MLRNDNSPALSRNFLFFFQNLYYGFQAQLIQSFNSPNLHFLQSQPMALGKESSSHPYHHSRASTSGCFFPHNAMVGYPVIPNPK